MPGEKLNMQVIEGDPYGTEYAQVVEMEIFKPGHWNWHEVSPEMVEEIALSYDADFVRAPLVIDHVERGPAFGHILEVDFRDEDNDKGEFSLWAKVGLLESGVELLKKGEFNERSVCISKFYPVQGLWYLNHVALLGAANPAVTGMAPVQILEGAEEESVDIGPELEARIELMPTLTFMTEKRRYVWDQTDEFLRYKVRNASRFRVKSFRTWDLDAEKAIAVTGGKLKPEYLPEGAEKNGMFIQSVLFDVEQWDLKKAKKWITKNVNTLNKDIDAEEVKACIELNINATTESFTKPVVNDETSELDKKFEVFAIDPALLGDEEENAFIEGKLGPQVIEEGLAFGSEEHLKALKKHNESLRARIAAKDAEIEALDTSEGIPVFIEDPPVEDTTKQVNNQATAIAEGGSQMPGAVETSAQIAEEKGATTPAPSDIPKAPLTIDDVHSVEAENFRLQSELDRRALEARKEQEKYEAELRYKSAELRVTTIRTKVQHMVTMGFLIPAQIDAGLILALAAFPDGVKVGEQDPVDIILNCLKQTGKLNLRTDVVAEVKEKEASDHPDLDKFGASGKAVRVDLAKRVRELRAEDPKLSHVDAFMKAEKEIGGDG